MADLVHCIYTSVQTRVLTPQEISELVEYSRRSNAERQLTGILLHVGSTFFQVLEGPREEIDLLYAKILKDPRHKQIAQIIYEPIPHRFFGEITMSLAWLSPVELSAALEEDDSERLEKLLAGLDEGRAKRLLRAFSQGRWRARLQPQVIPREAMA